MKVLCTKVSYSLKTKFSTAEDASNYTAVLEKFEEHFKPTKTVTYEKHPFLIREKKSGKTIDEYITALKELSETIEFKHLTDSLIKNRLVIEVNETAVKKTSKNKIFGFIKSHRHL